MSEPPIALEAYEALADAYAAMVDTKGHNAYYERPATLSLLPEVRGLQVLDAACGTGRYAEWLADHGARITAFDVSPRMLANARRRLGERVGERAQFLLADLNQPLAFLSDQSVDLVLCALGLDYVRDWQAVFAEFRRVLRVPGLLVFSIEHPLAEGNLWQARDYFRTERLEFTWRGFGPSVRMPAFRRPLMDVFNTLSAAGFAVDRVVEPLPTDEFKEQDPEECARLMERPGFLCVRAATR
jgi:ubiquinone/menaquinone biosynthesis C-methylase UbiE